MHLSCDHPTATTRHTLVAFIRLRQISSLFCTVYNIRIPFIKMWMKMSFFPYRKWSNHQPKPLPKDRISLLRGRYLKYQHSFWQSQFSVNDFLQEVHQILRRFFSGSVSLRRANALVPNLLLC